MNNAFMRKIVSDELRETLIFGGIVDDYHCKTKEVDSKGKTRYRFETMIGEILVYGPKAIYIMGNKFDSLAKAKQEVCRHVSWKKLFYES